MTKIGSVLSLAALLMALTSSAPGQAGTNAGTAAVSVEIVGGFGHLTSMELRADGTFAWHGWEPGRKVAPIHEGRLGPEQMKTVSRLAARVRREVPAREYSGGDHSYTLVLHGERGPKVEIKIVQGKVDARPTALKSMLDALWATRSRKQGVPESGSPGAGP